MSDSNYNGTYVPPKNPEELILSWIKRARESQFTHYECQKKYEARHLWLGIPAIIMTTLSGASIFKSLQQSELEWIKYIAMILALVATILTALQTFLNNEGRAKLHQEAGARYGSIRRCLESMNAHGNYDITEMREIEKELSDLAIRSPAVSVRDFEKTKKHLVS
ncbi:SLATT domain-containing protein [Aeromonas sp. 604534]|uniref:SLATT domain-containing protein n=1 Tax=Aeromonas sp. 604534 TaxID=2712055 RepID=UPI003BA27ACF